MHKEYEMSKYIIITDSASDLPDSYIKENGIDSCSLFYSIDDVVYGADKQMDTKKFFDAMRNGATPTTMAINPDHAEKCYRHYLEQGYDLLILAFSSGLSSTYNTSAITARELKEEFPDKKIIVIDTLCASLGQGLIVHKAIQNQKNGMSIEANANWIKDTIPHLCHIFTVDDLYNLQRGGRISKATAVIGTMINVKPVLHVDDEGHLVSLANVRGRKKAINMLADELIKRSEGYENDIIFISHGDCLEEAEQLRDIIFSKTDIKNCFISPLTPTIGAHAGPGTIALFFLGDHR